MMSTRGTCRAAALVAVLASAPLAEAAPTTLVASTGLRSFLPGHLALVTLADVAFAGDGSASVRLLLLDGQDQVLKEVTGIVRRGQPLTLRVLRDALANPGTRLPVRAVARIGLTANPLANLVAPVLTFETWNPTSVDDLVAETCLLPAIEPDSGGGGRVGNCGGSCQVDFDPSTGP